MIAFHPIRFRVALAETGLRNLPQFSAASGIGLATLKLITGGYLSSPETRQRIAAALGVAEDHVWPRVEVADVGAR